MFVCVLCVSLTIAQLTNRHDERCNYRLYKHSMFEEPDIDLYSTIESKSLFYEYYTTHARALGLRA